MSLKITGRLSFEITGPQGRDLQKIKNISCVVLHEAAEQADKLFKQNDITDVLVLINAGNEERFNR